MGKPSEIYIDPVCGKAVDTGSAAAELCCHGVRIYFCTQFCKQTFEADPRRFTPTRRKGFWRRYLERLTRITGGRPPACH